MTLRVKTMCLIALSLSALIGIIYITNFVVMGNSFEKLEEEYASRNVAQVSNAIENESEAIYTKLSDWANWDDTCKFIEDSNADYIESNLSKETFADLQLNLAIFMNNDGKTVFYKLFSLEKNEEIKTSDDIYKTIPVYDVLKSAKDIKGIVMTSMGPMIIAARPILSSKGEGPPKGSVLMGRFLDSFEITKLSKLTNFQISLDNISNSEDIKKHSSILSLLTDKNTVVVIPIDKAYTYGHSVLKDISGKKILLLNVKISRDISKSGNKSIQFFLILLLVSGLVLGAAILLALEKLALSRLEYLSNRVAEIGRTGRLGERIAEKGNDELGNLSREVNGMIAAIEKSHADIMESEYKLRYIFESINDGFAYFKIIPGINTKSYEFIFLEVNNAFLKIIDQKKDDILGKQASEIMTDFSFDFVQKFSLVEDKLSFEYYIEDRKKWYYVSTYCPFMEYLIVVFHDITNRKEIEAQLNNAKEAAEAANKAKGQFLANVSHEIRTPLNAIIGMTEFILNSGLDREQKRLTTLVKDAGELLLTIINGILDFSKMEAGKLILNNFEFDLSSSVDCITELLGVKARERNIELKSSLEPGLPIFLGDGDRLKQVLLNLVGNALKFTSNGSVSINAFTEEVHENLRTIKFEVTDTGTGIDEETLKRLFRPFEQADASTTRKYGGTGLGLSICKQIVEAMGGEIGVLSEKGKGSTFWFRLKLQTTDKKFLPAVQGEECQSAVIKNLDKKTDTSNAKSKILLAEDNQVNRELATIQFKKLGFNIDTAVNGREAVEAVTKGNYSLVFMDCQMPEMDGLEATRAIRSYEGSNSHVPIIAITANATEGSLEECIAAGMDAMVTKPVKIQVLSDTINKWMPK
ncbi:MAG TPA: CHASE4 domain-containing protein [Clostridia bacterium]